MDSCWSCLVVIENGAQTCPLCGADQKARPPAPAAEIETAPGPTSPALRWVPWAAAILSLCVLAGIVCYEMWPQGGDSPDAKAEAAATNALVDMRVVLSKYAMSNGDKYPSTLELLGAQAATPAQDAQTQGYSMVYTPRPAANGAITGFTLVAQPANTNCRNFYIDESGVLRATEERRPARVDDPPA